MRTKLFVFVVIVVAVTALSKIIIGLTLKSKTTQIFLFLNSIFINKVF